MAQAAQPAKPAAPTAAKTAEHAGLDDEARKLLTEQQTPRQFLDLLVPQGLLTDACRFLGQMLPKREAIWWALQCLRQAAGANSTPNAAKCLQVAEAWVLAPKEENRRVAKPAGDAGGAGTPAGALALAVYFSGGSMVADNLPAVPPPGHLTGVMAATAVLLAAHLDPAKADEALQKCVALGIEVAQGSNRWKEAAPAPASPPKPAAFKR
jgi:hypothetical protein